MPIDICGLIMARSGSRRVANKNIRGFADSSLLEIKIRQLLQLDELANTYVSSDSTEILDVASSAGATPIKRDPYFATSEVPINQVYKNLAESVSHEHVLFAHLTSPLVTVDTLRKCYQKYLELPSRYDSLATVTEFRKFLWYNDEPVNYSPDDMPQSQDLPNYFFLNFAYNIIPRSLMIRLQNIVGKRFFPYFLSDLESVDIDTMFEFDLAGFLYNHPRR